MTDEMNVEAFETPEVELRRHETHVGLPYETTPWTPSISIVDNDVITRLEVG